MAVDWGRAQRTAARTARLAVTMTKVRIRRAAAGTRWQLVTFCGPAGGETVGVVDLLAVRKDYRLPGPRTGMKRGDPLDMIFVQVKGGRAATPTAEDWDRLRAAARHHRACDVLLAVWRPGRAARFFRPLARRGRLGIAGWAELEDLDSVFR